MQLTSVLAIAVASALGAEAAGHSSSTQSCQAFPGEQIKQVFMLTVNADFVDMFKNLLHSAAPYVPDDMKVVVWPMDDAAVPMLEALARDGAHKFAIVRRRAASLLAAGGPASLLKKRGSRWSLLGKQGPHTVLRDGLDTGIWYNYNTAEYKELVSHRPLQIKHFLDQGCSVLYTDVDMAWKSNAFDKMRLGDPGGKANLLVANDHNTVPDLGLESNNLCSCIIYARPSEDAQAFMTSWNQLLKAGKGPHNNQPSFNKALQERRRTHPGFAVATLPLDYFPPGSTSRDSPAVLHANWMVGHDVKKRWLQSHGAWFVD